MKKILFLLLLLPVLGFSQSKTVDTFLCRFEVKNVPIKDSTGRVTSYDTTKHMIVGWVSLPSGDDKTKKYFDLWKFYRADPVSTGQQIKMRRVTSARITAFWIGQNIKLLRE